MTPPIPPVTPPSRPGGEDPARAAVRRRRARAAATAATGLTTAATLAATGWVAGLAADAHAADQARQQSEQQAQQARQRAQRQAELAAYRRELAAHRAAVRAARARQRGRRTPPAAAAHPRHGALRAGRDRGRRRPGHWRVGDRGPALRLDRLVELLVRRVGAAGRAGSASPAASSAAAPGAGAGPEQRLVSTPVASPVGPATTVVGPGAASRWSALGTYVHVAVDDPGALGAAAAAVTAVLDEVDRACSRFRPGSDLSRANAAPGRWVDVDPLLVEAAAVAVAVATATDGLVDPLLGRAMVQLGYDRTWRSLRPEADPAPGTTTDPAVRPGAWRELGLDPAGRVRVPPGTSLDLGATAKAFAADVAATAAADASGAGVLVSVGGDLRVAGSTAAWPVRVTEHPDGAEGTVVLLAGGGLATSSTVVRRWLRGGAERHHLLDPRTGTPVVTGPAGVRTATATGPTAAAANAAATAAVVLGPAADAWLAARGVAARLVAGDGTVRRTPGWPADATAQPTAPQPTDPGPTHPAPRSPR